MSMILIHHTSCGASRKVLELLRAAGVEPVIRKYMSDRLSAAELKDIAHKLGAGSPRAFLRDKDAAALGVTQATTDEALYALMAEHPQIIQRPILIRGAKAALGRPAENILKLAGVA